MRFNELNAAASKALADALSVNVVLNKLDVRDNNLGDAERLLLRDAVKGRNGFKLELL